MTYRGLLFFGAGGARTFAKREIIFIIARFWGGSMKIKRKRAVQLVFCQKV
jgi:hypothetical protein